MKLGKRITALALSACMLLGVAFVPTQAQEAGNGSGHRGDAYNNGITTAKTPVAKEETGLLWAKKLGNSAGPALIVNDSVYAYSGNKIYKLNKNNGEVEAEGTLELGSNSWAQPFGSSTYPVTYGNGKIYVGLSDCKIQALDATTLESKWVYEENLKSPGYSPDTTSPIVYKDSKIYVGFYPGWGSSNTAFVCINADSGKAEWNEEEEGSFQANGAAIIGNYVVYGNTTTGNITSRNKDNGELVEKLPVESAGIKSGIVYNNGKIYCVASKPNNKATLVVADFDSTTGKFDNLQTTDFSAYGTYSVNTPVVYNGIVYVGVGSRLEGGKVVAVDPSKENAILWAQSVTGYPEGAILLSSAYEKEDSIYLYTTYNYKNPEGIDVVRVKADGSSAESYNLFINGSAAGMSTSGIIADENGTLYYSNQSGYIMAVAAKNTIDNLPAATEVEKKIAALPSEEEITLDNESAISEARKAYDKLTEAQKELVNKDRLQALEKAEAKINSLKKAEADKEAAATVVKQINELGEIDLTKEEQIKAARAAYDQLTDDQKKLVTNLSVLEKAEQTMKDLKAAQSGSTAEKTDTKPGATSTAGKTNTTKANPVIKEGMTVKTDFGKEYVKILSTTKKRVAYVKPAKKTYKNVTVSATVNVSGEKYKVVAVSAGAFKKMPKLQKVTLGNNVEEIGAKAFYKSKKLNKIVITSKKLTSRKVSTKAFSSTNKKITVKVPKKKYKAYKKFLAKSGNKTIRIKK